MISEKVKRDIRQYFLSKFPEEACGFVIDDEFVPVENIHEDPKEAFSVSRKDWKKFAPKCKIFVHSHPNWYPVPSEEDMMQQIATDIPWGIMGLDGREFTDIIVFGTDERPDLVGRPFCHGVTDCYSIIRDWYKLEKNIDLDEIPRDWEWWDKDKDLYKDNFKPVGFEVVPEAEIRDNGPQVGDVFLAKVGLGVKKLNHGGVYIGNGLGLHHLSGKIPIDKSRLSKREPVNRWLKYIELWVRYVEKDTP